MAIDIEAIRSRLRPLEEVEKLSERLLPSIPAGEWYFGLIHTDAEFDLLDIIHEELLQIRKVQNPPGIVHVCRAADLETTDYLGVGRYSAMVKVEIVSKRSKNKSSIFGLVWHAVALLRLKGHSSLICPVASSESWDAINAIKKNKVKFRLLDDVPRQIALEKKAIALVPEDIEWVSEHYESALKLRDIENSKRFGLAFEIAYSWNLTADVRLAFANIWFALEALFGDQNERPVTKNLARRISAWLKKAEFDQEVRDLYNIRCDVVHGRNLDMLKLRDALNKSWDLLRKSLILAIESETVPLPDWREIGRLSK